MLSPRGKGGFKMVTIVDEGEGSFANDNVIVKKILLIFMILFKIFKVRWAI